MHVSSVQGPAAVSETALKRQVMVVLCGAQGSGKSTFCHKLIGRAEMQWHRVNQVRAAGRFEGCWTCFWQPGG